MFETIRIRREDGTIDFEISIDDSIEHLINAVAGIGMASVIHHIAISAVIAATACASRERESELGSNRMASWSPGRSLRVVFVYNRGMVVAYGEYHSWRMFILLNSID